MGSYTERWAEIKAMVPMKERLHLLRPVTPAPPKAEPKFSKEEMRNSTRRRRGKAASKAVREE